MNDRQQHAQQKQWREMKRIQNQKRKRNLEQIEKALGVSPKLLL